MCTMMTNDIMSILHMYVKSLNHEIHWVIRLLPISLVPIDTLPVLGCLVRGKLFGRLPTYAVGVQPKGEGSGFPPYWCVTYQAALYPYFVDAELQVYTRGMVKDGKYVYMDHLVALDGNKQGQT